ncbi:right-handed parallel beta-helix repeat-containing protein [Nocardioides jejuensis]|uniref:right-handed parallel beta-helix repeat-containing protein n=1 Tax=Nocardioides jejuensis TaxID=2502782 RepID=UPI00140548AD|nr:right-handed parallel beta-helix repeat-containing protein [Nocardioides jejuensis]
MRKYGAVADGVTDCTSAFKATIDAAAQRVQSTLGLDIVEVVIPSSSSCYRVGPLTIPSNVELVGNGPRPRLVPTAPVTRWLITADNGRNIAVRNLVLDTHGDVSDAVITMSPGTTGLSIVSTEITNSAGTPSRAGVDTRPGTKNLAISACTLSGYTAVRLGYDPVDTTIEQTTFKAWLDRAIWIRSDATYALNGLLVDGCTILPPAPGGTVRQPIQINGVDSRLIQNVTITNNRVTGPGTDYNDTTTPGTADLISLHRCTAFTVRGNTVTGGGDVGITVAQQSCNGVVADNLSFANFSAGIAIGSGTSAYVRDISVSGNRCLDNGRTGMNDTTPDSARTGLYLRNAQTISVADNRSGSDNPTTSQLYGISTTQSTEIGLSGNDLRGNARGETYAG